VYGAKSSPDERESVLDQQRIVGEAIEREGDRQVVGTFGEANQSGYRKSRGPQLEAAIAAVTAAAENGPAELWVFHSTRLGRGTGEKGEARALGKLLYDLRARGVTVRSVGDDAFTTTEQLWSIASSQSSQYSKDLGTHTARGIAKRKQAGKPFGGVPCGYRRELTVVDDQVVAKRVIDPNAAATVEAIFAAVEAGQGWNPIATTLNARGLRTVRGNHWTGTAVRDVARSPLYRGEKGYPVLIEPERWERVQGLLDDTPAARQRRQGGRPPKDESRFLLRGMVFCASCGAPMYSCAGKNDYYQCRDRRGGRGVCNARHVPAKLADERVLHHLDTFIFGVEDWIADRVAERTDQYAAMEQALQQEVAVLGDLERLRAKLMAEYERQVEAGRTTAHLALEVVERKDREVEQQQRRIDAARSRVAEWTGAPDADAALDYYNDLVAAIRNRVSGAAAVDQVNAVLSTIVAGIWLGYDGKKLEASFALRPLDGREDVSGLAQVLSAEGKGRWPLPEPAEGDPDPIDDTREALRTTCGSNSIQSVCRRFSEASTSRMIQRRELPA
jgi:DNA invertase Pin-like site-specific DNA recombinase